MTAGKLLGVAALTWFGMAAYAARASEPSAENVSTPRKPVAWSAAAIADIEASYRILRNEHPGMVDPANAAFSQQLDRARSDALHLARQVRDAGGYSAALAAFQADLRDGHAGPFARLPDKVLPAPRWPGFVTTWRDDSLYVYASEAGGPPHGAKLIECDGTGIADLLRANVFRFEGRPDEPGQWWSRASHLMIDAGNPFIRLPRRCTIEAKGDKLTIALSWRPITEQAKTWRNDAYNGDMLPLGVSQPRSRLFWIAMPTFAPDPTDVARYDALFATLDERPPALLSARAVVLDLRHNRGGSSNWSLRVAQGLWGRRAFDAAMTRYGASEHARWRATPGNLATVRAEAESSQRDGDLEGARERTTVAKGLAEALAAGRQIYDQPADPTAPPTISSAGSPELQTSVYVIVPGQCASACLDALDIFTRFPNVTLIGAPSSGDTNYIDVREEPLPSGLGALTVPMKVIIGRSRKAGQIYKPRVVMSGLSWSTSAFADAIESDLKSR